MKGVCFHKQIIADYAEDITVCLAVNRIDMKVRLLHPQ